MRLETPEKIRTLQKKLYVKAKSEPSFRFYSLLDKICRNDVLAFAWCQSKANDGAAGVDGHSFAAIERSRLERWMLELQDDLRSGRYAPDAVRRVLIPKPGGGERALGIPTVRDRVAQTAAALVLLPIFEADFTDEMYGYRPRRDAHGALAVVHAALKEGRMQVVDADLSKYFDTIPHGALLRLAALRVSDGAVLRLIRQWLKAPIEERDERGRRRRSGGRDHDLGTPQGGVISPLLSNVYMNAFLRAWKTRAIEAGIDAKVVNYADDFVLLCRSRSDEALAITRTTAVEYELTLNETKTKLRDARRETFDFLGYTFGPAVHRPTGRRYLCASPSRAAVTRLRAKVRTVMHRSNVNAWEEITASLNRILRGWAEYFSFGHIARSYWWVDAFVLRRARGFLTRRHKLHGMGTRHFPPEKVFGPGGIVCLGWQRRGIHSHA